MALLKHWGKVVTEYSLRSITLTLYKNVNVAEITVKHHIVLIKHGGCQKSFCVFQFSDAKLHALCLKHFSIFIPSYSYIA